MSSRRRRWKNWKEDGEAERRGEEEEGMCENRRKNKKVLESRIRRGKE